MRAGRRILAMQPLPKAFGTSENVSKRMAVFLSLFPARFC